MKKDCSNCSNGPCGSDKCIVKTCGPSAVFKDDVIYFANWKHKPNKTPTQKLEMIKNYADSLIDFNIMIDSDTIGNQLLELLK